MSGVELRRGVYLWLVVGCLDSSGEVDERARMPLQVHVDAVALVRLQISTASLYMVMTEGCVCVVSVWGECVWGCGLVGLCVYVCILYVCV